MCWLLFLSDLNTFGAGGPNQNTSRIQHKKVNPILFVFQVR